MIQILNGYHVERISQDGEVEVLRRLLSYPELILISTMERLPVILPTTEDERIKTAYTFQTIFGYNYRYSGFRLIASKFTYIVLLPKNYAYTNYILSLPKTITHYRRSKKFSINQKEVVVVKSRGLESRFHVGPNIGLFHNPWENVPCFAFYYINPNDAKEVDMDLCLDIAPLKEPELEILPQIYEASRQRSDKPNLIQEVIHQAHKDSENQEIKVTRDQVGSFEALEGMLHLIVKNTQILLKGLQKLGMEIRRGGRKPYKIKNPQTGKTAPISRRGEFKPYEIKGICDELGIDYNELLKKIHKQYRR